MILFNTKNNRCILIDPSMDDSHADRNVLAIGSQVITPGQPYPPKGFPEGSLFEDSGGRCLDNFQIVYVVKGSGHFNDRGINYMVTPGTLMIIRPGYWHSYAPDPKTGWVEYMSASQEDCTARSLTMVSPAPVPISCPSPLSEN